jgi:hypothetical protein
MSFGPLFDTLIPVHTQFVCSLKWAKCLWALVWLSSPCFDSQFEFECSHKVSEIGYHFMKLGIISSEDLQVIFWQAFDLIKKYEQWSGREGKSKTGGETPRRTNLGENTSLVGFYVCTVFIPTSHFIPSFTKQGPTTPSLGVHYG